MEWSWDSLYADGVILGSNGQRSRLGLGLGLGLELGLGLQKKHIEGDQVAGVSYALYRVLNL